MDSYEVGPSLRPFSLSGLLWTLPQTRVYDACDRVALLAAEDFGMSQTSGGLTAEAVVNTEAYPIIDTDSAAFTTLTERLREQLDARQYVVLPDFIRPAARSEAVRQIQDVLHLANHNCADRNCYLQRAPDPALPNDHPRNVFMSASSRMLAADLLPADSPLKALYCWDKVKALVARIVGVERLYDNEDPLQPVNALCYRTGDRSAWHFDSTNAFTMTLMLQAPVGGGRFEMIPNIRSDEDQNYEGVGAAVLGDRTGAVEVGREEGALCIFRGCNSLHRVSPVEGDRMRIMGVFVYENEPGVIGDPEVNATVYGRPTAMAP